MLSQAKQKIIRSLGTKKGRAKHGLCLVEGEKLIEAAGDALEFTFTSEDVDGYRSIVSTVKPQEVTGVARIPDWSKDEVAAVKNILVLDGVQDPGNVGTMLRLCQAFNASMVLIDSVDVTNPKVVRSSAGALFHVPWMNIGRDQAPELIREFTRPVYKLDFGGEETFEGIADGVVLIAGSEGQGVKLDIDARPFTIGHEPALESLNVGHATAIALHKAYTLAK